MKEKLNVVIIENGNGDCFFDDDHGWMIKSDDQTNNLVTRICLICGQVEEVFNIKSNNER